MHPKDLYVIIQHYAAACIYDSLNDPAAAERQCADLLAQILSELKKILGQDISDSDHLLTYCLHDRLPTEALDLNYALHQLYVSQCALQKRMNSDPLPDWNRALNAIEIMRIAGQYDSWRLYADAAVIHKNMAQYCEVTNRPESEEHDRIALYFFKSSIPECEEYIAELDDDISAIAILAWAYCGKFACLNRLLRAAPPQQEAAAQAYLALQRAIPSSGSVSLNNLFKNLITASRTTGEPDVADILKVAGQVTDSVFQGVDPHKDRKPEIRDILGWDRQKEFASLAVELGSEPYQYLNAATERGDDVLNVLSTTARMTNLILSSVKAEEFDGFEERTGWFVEREEALTACENRFNSLWGHEEVHYQAESAYGFACLRAIQSKEEEAILHLENSLTFIYPSRAYHQRAEFDEDLDSIRASEEFRRVLYGSQGATTTGDTK